jgi:hypothetical protein
MLAFTKASKSQARLRAALFGPSGSGKTYSALRVITGMADGKKIAVVDTERGSASKYADRFAFDTLDLDDKTIDGYVAAISAAAAAGYEYLVIDSLSHGWQELLDEVDKLAKTKYRGNTWSAWSDGTPKQRRLIDAILNFPGHLIATMRSKTEWQTETGNNGKSKPVRVGLAPEQGKGIEYEFDLLMELSTQHIAEIIKDRTGKYQDKLIDKPGEDFGRELAAWLSDGVAVPAPVDVPVPVTVTVPAPAPAPVPAIITGTLGKVITPVEGAKIQVCRIELDVPLDSAATAKETLGTYNAELFHLLPRYTGCEIRIPYTVNERGNKIFDEFTMVSGDPLPF